MPVNHKPDGYHSVTPYLYIRGAANAIEFYKKALGAEELFRLPDKDGRIGHAELKIGDSVVMYCLRTRRLIKRSASTP